MSRLKMKDTSYLTVFNEEVEQFKERIRERAKLRIEDAVRRVEEVKQKPQKQVGCGGVD